MRITGALRAAAYTASERISGNFPQRLVPIVSKPTYVEPLQCELPRCITKASCFRLIVGQSYACSISRSTFVSSQPVRPFSITEASSQVFKPMIGRPIIMASRIARPSEV